MPTNLGPESLPYQRSEKASESTASPKATDEEMQANAKLRVQIAQENQATEQVDRSRELAQIDEKIDVQNRKIAIAGPALEQLTKSGITDRLVGIMRDTFGNRNIRRRDCSFTAETALVNGQSYRAIDVLVNGSDTRLAFGFGQVGQRWQLGQLQLSAAETKLVESLFRQP